ncbi:MAG: hypothetical protein WAZ36_03810 [Sediminibacterium sp.]
MKKRILDIIDDIKNIVKCVCEQKFWIDWYGSYDIDPKYLVIWICVESDNIKLGLESNKELVNKLRETLIKNNYPKEAVPFVHIGFESQETVDRESNGDWYKHFK